MRPGHPASVRDFAKERLAIGARVQQQHSGRAGKEPPGLGDDQPLIERGHVHTNKKVVDGVRWVVVEYASGAGRTEWCDSPAFGLRGSTARFDTSSRTAPRKCGSRLGRRFGFRPPLRSAAATMEASPRACS